MRFCPLCSGSSGNASFLEAGDVRLLIDAGLTGKRIEALLAAIDIDPSTLTGILVTHEHTDHIQGVGVLSRRYGLPVYANSACFTSLLPLVGGLPARAMRVFEPDKTFFMGDLRVLPFSTPHDAAHPVGYTFTLGERKVSVMTDVGHVSSVMLDAVENSDLLLLESNHDVDMLKAGSYPYPLKMRILGSRGHLCNEDAGLVLKKLHERGVRSAVLGHLSKENNTPELAMVTVQTVLDDAGMLGDTFLTVAKRDQPTGIFDL